MSALAADAQEHAAIPASSDRTGRLRFVVISVSHSWIFGTWTL
jgi:hypothetical protein